MGSVGLADRGLGPLGVAPVDPFATIASGGGRLDAPGFHAGVRLHGQVLGPLGPHPEPWDVDTWEELLTRVPRRRHSLPVVPPLILTIFTTLLAQLLYDLGVALASGSRAAIRAARDALRAWLKTQTTTVDWFYWHAIYDAAMTWAAQLEDMIRAMEEEQALLMDQLRFSGMTLLDIVAMPPKPLPDIIRRSPQLMRIVNLIRDLNDRMGAANRDLEKARKIAGAARDLRGRER